MITSKHDLIRQLELRSNCISSMNLTKTEVDGTLGRNVLNFANVTADLDRVARAIETLIGSARLSNADAMSSLRNLIDERHLYGTYCELGTYDWLDRSQVKFAAQLPLLGADVLNPSGCVIDGKFSTIDCYFDVKAFGFQAYVAEVFCGRLKQRLGSLDVSIEGSMDVAVRDIDTHAFGQMSALATKLAGGGNERIPQLNWIIRAQPQQPVSSTVQTIDPFKLARENRYYPFKTAGQFTRNAKFMQIFTYASQFNLALALNHFGTTDITLRALARRVFMELTVDSTPAVQFDRRVASNTLVSDAAKLISGLLFISLDNDNAHLFVNPRATHRMSRFHVERLFDFMPPRGLTIDDFVYDDY